MREFSEESRQHFYDLIEEVNDNQLCDATDWLGDKINEYDWLFGYASCGIYSNFNVADYYGEVDEYWTKVIDDNNTEKSEIDGIFEAVQGVDEDYESKFSQYIEPVTAQIKLIKSLGEIVQPEQGNFTIDKINEKVGVESEELIAAYVNMAKKNGNDGEYDFEIIKAFFEKKPDEVSEYEYYAMIAIFNDMDNQDKEKFIESAYKGPNSFIPKREYSGVGEFEISDTFKKMVEYYEISINTVSENNLDNNSDNYEKTMQFISNYSILSIFTNITPELYVIGTQGPFIDSQTLPDITISEKELNDHKEYQIEINGAKCSEVYNGAIDVTTNETQEYTVYEMFGGDRVLDIAAENSFEQFKSNPKDSATANFVSSAFGIYMGFMNLNGFQNIVMSSPLAIYSGIDSWNKDVDSNKNATQGQEAINEGNLMYALCAKSAIIVSKDGTYTITVTYVNTTVLEEKIQNYNSEKNNADKLNVSAEELKQAWVNNTGLDQIKNLDDFVAWRCDDDNDY